jgi:regulator of RNase E activity RraA
MALGWLTKLFSRQRPPTDHKPAETLPRPARSPERVATAGHTSPPTTLEPIDTPTITSSPAESVANPKDRAVQTPCTPLHELTAEALIKKAEALDLQFPDEAAAARRELVTRFSMAAMPASTSSELGLRETGSGALLRMAQAKILEGNPVEGVARCDEVIAWIGAARQRVLRAQLCRAFLHKADGLDRLDRTAEARAIRLDVLTQFGKAMATSERDAPGQALFRNCETWQTGRAIPYGSEDLTLLWQADLRAITRLTGLAAHKMETGPQTMLAAFARTVVIRPGEAHPRDEAGRLRAFCEHLAAEPWPTVLAIQAAGNGEAGASPAFHATPGMSTQLKGMLADTSLSATAKLATLAGELLTTADALTPWRDRCCVVEFGVPVSVGGLAVEPNDLILIDDDGIIAVSSAKAKGYAERAAAAELAEREAYPGLGLPVSMKDDMWPGPG